MTEKKASLFQVLCDAVQILAEFLPEKTYLYFPLIYNSLVWMAKRPEEWRKKVFSWQVWPDPDALLVKSDDFVISFFEDKTDLHHAFRDEIKQKNMGILRKAFLSLYPLLGLENPFLLALFDEEIKAKHYKKIPQVFEERVMKAEEDIGPLIGRPEGRRALVKIGEELVSLGDLLLSKSEVKKSIEEIMKREREKKDE